MRPISEKSNHVERAKVVIAPGAADVSMKSTVTNLFGGATSKLKQTTVRGYVEITTTATITVKYNTTSDDAIEITSTRVFVDDCTAISDLFISSTPGATITILLKYI